MKVVVWGHGSSWIVKQFDEEGRCVRQSHWMGEGAARALAATWEAA